MRRKRVFILWTLSVLLLGAAFFVASIPSTKLDIDKRYVFVRVNAGRIEHTDFMRHNDGSAYFVADGNSHIYEGAPAAWRHALSKLTRLGFVELGEAQAQGHSPTRLAAGHRRTCAMNSQSAQRDLP